MPKRAGRASRRCACPGMHYERVNGEWYIRHAPAAPAGGRRPASWNRPRAQAYMPSNHPVLARGWRGGVVDGSIGDHVAILRSFGDSHATQSDC